MNASPIDADQIIAELGLAQHPEGGWYRQTWRDDAGTAILYLLRAGERSAWHRVHHRAEIWHFYGGAPLTLRCAPDVVTTLGADLGHQQAPQAVVPPGVWQCAETTGPWSLVGTTVAPPFDFTAFELAPAGFDPHDSTPITPNVAGTSNVAGVTSDPSPEPAGAAAGSAETLAIDIGGTGLKASVLDRSGQMERDQVRIETPYPLPPDKMIHVLADLVKPLGGYDRVSAGFPGMVRAGVVLSAPHFISPSGPGGTAAPKLVAAWKRFNLQSELAKALGKPTKVANDADLQGSAVVTGHGLEVVVTLGTGVGTAMFYEGMLESHLELAQHAFRKDQTYNEALGDAARKRVGPKKWNKRVVEMVDVLRNLTFFDHLYIGGGNATKIDVKLPSDVSTVDNKAGILGGIKLWERTT